jgi:hypothetical protein
MAKKMRAARITLAVLAASLASTRSLADIVHFSNGQSIEGKVEKDEKAGTVTIETTLGKVVRPLSDVREIEKKPLPAEEFEARFQKLPDGDLRPMVELANWAREKNLQPELRRVARRILAIDPNHELAREALGYVVFENRWVLEKELRKLSSSRGLVKLGGEWVTLEEKERRVVEEARKDLEAHFRGITSKNAYVQEASVRAVLEYRGPHAFRALASFVGDSREPVRLLVASALASMRTKTGARVEDAEAKRVAADLYAQLLAEPSDTVLKALHLSLRAVHPREGFRLSLGTLQESSDEEALRRASQALHECLMKQWVPELCRAVVARPAEPAAAAPDGAPGGAARREYPAVRTALRRALGQDFGYDPDAWLRWWGANADKFTDVP